MSPSLQRLVQALAVETHFQDFAKGIISLTAVLYFGAVAVFFLYLNVLVLSRRHWPLRADGYPMWVHHAVRAVAVLAWTSGRVSAPRKPSPAKCIAEIQSSGRVDSVLNQM